MVSPLDQFINYGGALLGWVLILALAFQQGFDHFKVMFLDPVLDQRKFDSDARLRVVWAVRALLVVGSYYLIWGGNAQTVTQLPFMALFPPIAGDFLVILLVIGGAQFIHLLQGLLEELKVVLEKLKLPSSPTIPANLVGQKR